MLIFISGNEAFYDDDKILYVCHVGINDTNMSLQYDAYGKTEQEALERAASLAYLLNSVDSQLKVKAEQN